VPRKAKGGRERKGNKRVTPTRLQKEKTTAIREKKMTMQRLRRKE